MSAALLQVSEGEPIQHSVLHSMARLVVGAVTGRGALVSNAVHVDTVFKGTEVRADVKPEAKSGLISNVMSRTGDAVTNALGVIGLRHRFGGNTPESGLDCSGLVRYVFNDTFGFLLPRHAMEMSRVDTNADMVELRPDDLVFFNTMCHTFSHVGIYVGNNKFVHISSTGSKIRIDDMTVSYRATCYNGARRIEGNSDTAIKDDADSFVE